MRSRPRRSWQRLPQSPRPCRGWRWGRLRRPADRFARSGPRLVMKLNSMKPAKISKRLRAAGEVRRQRGQQQARGAADEAEDLQRDPAHRVGQHDGEDDADDQQAGDQRRALGGGDVVGDQIGDAAGVVRIGADRSGQDRRREDADAVGAEVLQEPGNRGQDRGAPVGLVEQRGVARAGLRCAAVAWPSRVASLISAGYCGLRTSSFFTACSALLDFAARRQPVGALDDVEAADRDEHARE